MKKIRMILLAVCLFLCSVFATGCIVQAQSMRNLKGTYKLTSATESGKGDFINYIERDGEEVYLVITGNSRGYLVRKSNTISAYAKEIDLIYHADQEQTNKYAHVGFKDSTQMKVESENNLYIVKDRVYYNRPELEIGILYQSAINVSYEKVSKKTDLSYVKEQLGEFSVYGYEEWKHQAYYSGNAMPTTFDTIQSTQFVNPYAYYYTVLDTYAKKATTYSLLKGVDKSEAVVKEETITLVDGWNTIKIDNAEWVLDGNNYTRVIPATETQIEYKIVLNKQNNLETGVAKKWVDDEIVRFLEYDYVPPVCDKFVDVEGDDDKCDTCTHFLSEHAICNSYVSEQGNRVCDICAHYLHEHEVAVCDNYEKVPFDNETKCNNCYHEKAEHTFPVCDTYADSNEDGKCDNCFNMESSHTIS